MELKLKGTGVALVTPFDDTGAVDYRALERLVEYAIAGGVDFLVALGTTAETPTLSPRERSEVFSCISSAAAGRVPLVVGMGGNDTAALCESLGSADLGDARAVLSVTPYYNRPSQEGLFRHYRAVAAASPLPVILYNVPARTGVNMLPETVARLACIDNIAAVKEASADREQIARLLSLCPPDFLVFSGDDNMALPLVEGGGHGLISVAANVIPSEISGMVRTALTGGASEAERMWERIAPVVSSLFAEGNPTGVKTALSVAGIAAPWVRLPLVEGSQELALHIASLMREAGIAVSEGM